MLFQNHHKLMTENKDEMMKNGLGEAFTFIYLPGTIKKVFNMLKLEHVEYFLGIIKFIIPAVFQMKSLFLSAFIVPGKEVNDRKWSTCLLTAPIRYRAGAQSRIMAMINTYTSPLITHLCIITNSVLSSRGQGRCTPPPRYVAKTLLYYEWLVRLSQNSFNYIC